MKKLEVDPDQSNDGVVIPSELIVYLGKARHEMGDTPLRNLTEFVMSRAKGQQVFEFLGDAATGIVQADEESEEEKNEDEGYEDEEGEEEKSCDEESCVEESCDDESCEEEEYEDGDEEESCDEKSCHEEEGEDDAEKE